MRRLESLLSTHAVYGARLSAAKIEMYPETEINQEPSLGYRDKARKAEVDCGQNFKGMEKHKSSSLLRLESWTILVKGMHRPERTTGATFRSNLYQQQRDDALLPGIKH